MCKAKSWCFDSLLKLQGHYHRSLSGGFTSSNLPPCQMCPAGITFFFWKGFLYVFQCLWLLDEIFVKSVFQHWSTVEQWHETLSPWQGDHNNVVLKFIFNIFYSWLFKNDQNNLLTLHLFAVFVWNIDFFFKILVFFWGGVIEHGCGPPVEL